MDKKIIAIIAIIIIGILAIGFYFTNNNDSETDDNVVNIGHLPSDHDAALFVAKEKKMYESQGLQVEITQFNNGGDLITAMASGDIDVGYVGITPVLSSISQKVPIKIVSGAQIEGSSIVANKNSGINTVEDLKGKNVATPGEATIQYILLSYALNQSGVSTNNVEFTTMKAAQMTDTLKAGRIDAMIIWEPYASIAVKNGAGKLVETSGQIVAEHPCCCVVAREDFIKKHNDKLKKILKAHENATKFINENPEEASNCLPDDIVPDKKLQKDIVANTTYIYGLDNNYKEKVMDFMNLEIELGVLDKPLTEEQLFADV
ncbi:ABC transporter substrate-binding protein [uncultured Methanobrevibacter sp.]|uniref:ABC transporter substrate-binding protein n=1 Tax=uncultured Methanobrevibacter sp. TaxID=253161 RepID=UPI0025DA2DE5|nr:ABC transporter substrate-binding protein [uncultured Methanobrevibacter sp.]